MAARDGAVIVLLSTPWAGQKQQAGQARERWQQGQRRYNASDFQLRGSDVAYIMDKAMSCDLGGRLSDLFQKWQASGSWQDSSQLVIGAAKLQKPRGLQNMGELRSREDFLLWHAWGRPLPHEQFPQMLFFEVLESVCFVEEHDLQVFATRLRVAEQRSSWVARLSDAAQQSLQHAACTDGRSFQRRLREWQMPRNTLSLHPSDRWCAWLLEEGGMFLQTWLVARGSCFESPKVRVSAICGLRSKPGPAVGVESNLISEDVQKAFAGARGTFLQALRKKDDVGWKDKQEKELLESLGLWLALIQSWSAEEHVVQQVLGAPDPLEVVRDLLGRKALSTLIKRYRSLVSYCNFLGSRDVGFPGTEGLLCVLA